MKKIFKKNQIVLTLLAVMIVVAGYLNYAGKADKDSIANANADIAKDSELLDISEADILAENELYASAGIEKDAVENAPEAGKDAVENAPEDKNDNAQLDAGEAQADDGIIPDAPADTGEIKDIYTAAEEPDSINIDSVPGEAILTNGMNIVDYVSGVQLEREQTRARNKETLNELINNESLSEEQRQSAVNSMLRLTELAQKETTTESLLGAKGFENSIVCICDDYVDVIVGRKAVTEAEKVQIEDIVKRQTGFDLSDIVITMFDIEE
ncbi:MAG: SpoIIIAH-like family protein [Lachnospiraceae bacterium]|nr:SpoIIIAH-like family protein [Lachnospiraceae bacterium]